MSSDVPEPKRGSLQSMLARLRALADAHRLEEVAEPQSDQPLPAWDIPLATEGESEVPVALPIEWGATAPIPLPVEGIPLAHEVPLPETTADDIPMAQPVIAAAVPFALSELGVEPENPALAEPQPAPAAPAFCSFCQAPRVTDQSYCPDCGLVFPTQSEQPADSPPAPMAANYLQGRYELGALISQQGDHGRYRGFDHGAWTDSPIPVVIVRGPRPPSPEPSAPRVEDASAIPDEAAEEILPILEELPLPGVPATEILRGSPVWPGLVWESTVLTKARHPALPAVLDLFSEGEGEYLVEEAPAGRVLWDAWDQLPATAEERFSWLKQIAEGLQHLHRAGAIVEALRPDIIVVGHDGQARLADLSELLPLPLPPQSPVRGSLYAAPELVLSSHTVDERADLFGFGAMLYALHVGRELTEMDFERPGLPKPFMAQFPDVHPLLGRLVSKTFCREVERRFPSDEASADDGTGFTELIQTLETCRHALDNVRLEIAAWTTTGMVRTGNEDVLAVLHGLESRQDELGESALILLADGMGGYEAGEVAAALTIKTLRKYLLQQKLFAVLAGDTWTAQMPFDLDLCQRHIQNALKEANKEVYGAARGGMGRRGMGCTAEVVYVNGRHIVVGHVGDSRTYHLHEGRLVQLTRDQTLVNRLMELGTLTPEEAAKHPRRSELQQAIGGHANVEPALYHGLLKPRDWVVVCSDGLSNHVNAQELQHMLQTEATSAEMAARRLVNFANIKGATDNATVIVVRVT